MNLFKKFPACAALALATCLLAPAVAQDKKVALLPNWHAGDQVEYRVEKAQTSHQGAVQWRNISTAYRIQIAVEQASPTRSVQRWTIAPVAAPGNAAEQGQHGPTALAEFVPTPLVLELALDESGGVTELLNWSALRTQMLDKFDELARRAPEANANRSPLSRNREAFSAFTSTEARLRTILTRDAQTLLSPVGGAYTLDKTTEAAITTSTPFSAQPMPGKQVVRVASVPGQSNRFTLDLEEAADPVAMGKLMAALGEKLGRKTDGPVAASMERKIHYSFELPSGWPQTATWQQQSNAAGDRSLESLSYRRVK